MAVTDVVLAMGVCKQPPDRARLNADIEVLLSKYRQMPLSSIDAGGVMQEFLALARRHDIAMPASLTMLARSVVILESVLTHLDPDTNLLQIMSLHIQKDAIGPEQLQKRIEKIVRQLYGSPEKLSAIPGQISDALARLLSGHVTLGVNVAGQEQESRASDRRNTRLSLTILAASLILGTSLISLSGLPGPGGLSWLGLGLPGLRRRRALGGVPRQAVRPPKLTQAPTGMLINLVALFNRFRRQSRRKRCIFHQCEHWWKIQHLWSARRPEIPENFRRAQPPPLRAQKPRSGFWAL